MRGIIFGLTLLISTCAFGETISLTCVLIDENGKRGEPHNTTIVGPTANSPGKIYLNDKLQGGASEYGITTISNISINNSEIKWDMDYESFPKTYPDPKYNLTAGRMSYQNTISRSSGILTSIQTGYGGLSKVLGTEGTKIVKQQCEARKANKF